MSFSRTRARTRAQVANGTRAVTVLTRRSCPHVPLPWLPVVGLARPGASFVWRASFAGQLPDDTPELASPSATGAAAAGRRVAEAGAPAAFRPRHK
jgi:hypothetical protein